MARPFGTHFQPHTPRWKLKMRRVRLKISGRACATAASGNGKSTLITGNAIYGASKDGERGAEVYCIANAKDQAKIIFDECKAEIEVSPMLLRPFGTYFQAHAPR